MPRPCSRAVVRTPPWLPLEAASRGQLRALHRTALAGDLPVASEMRVIDVLKSEGGAWTGRQRVLALRLQLERTATNELLSRMAGKGLISLQPSPRGTAISLPN